MIVKVVLPEAGTLQARVRSADGKIDMLIPAPMAARRFADKSEMHGFFNATLEEDVLEIGDRVASEDW
jgi:hypothetical protein